MASQERNREGEREREGEQKGKKRTAPYKFINWDCFHVCNCQKAQLLGVRSARFIRVFALWPKSNGLEFWGYVRTVPINFLAEGQQPRKVQGALSNYPELVQDLHWTEKKEHSLRSQQTCTLISHLSFSFIKCEWGNSLVVQLLSLCASNAGGTGLIPGRETNVLHAPWHHKKYIENVNNNNDYDYAFCKQWPFVKPLARNGSYQWMELSLSWFLFLGIGEACSLRSSYREELGLPVSR